MTGVQTCALPILAADIAAEKIAERCQHTAEIIAGNHNSRINQFSAAEILRRFFNGNHHDMPQCGFPRLYIGIMFPLDVAAGEIGDQQQSKPSSERSVYQAYRSGERKWMRLNLCRVIADRCCGAGVVGCVMVWLLTGRRVIN